MKKKIFKLPRKLVFIILYLVILPVAIISTLFIVTYQTNKPTLFTVTNSNNETVTPKIVSPSAIDSFTFDFYCSEYNEPTFNSKNECTTKTTMRFKAAAYNKKSTISVANISYKVMFASYWIGYQTNQSSSYTLTLASSQEKATYRTTSISNYDLQYPKRTLLFINKKTPDAYVLLTWEETDNKTKETTSMSYIIKYVYSQYFVPGLSIGGITTK